MLKGFSHAAIWVTDIDRAIDFYTRIPGVKEHFRLYYEDGSLWLVYLQFAPMQFLELFPRGKGPYERPTNAAFAHICLEAEDIHSFYDAVVANGITPRDEIKLGADGSYQFWIDDPDGNPIEFQQFVPSSKQVTGGRTQDGTCE